MATAAGFTVRYEETLKSGYHPGDLLIEECQLGEDGAVDLACVHVLNLSANWAPDVFAVDLTEQVKDTHYAAHCAQAGLSRTTAGIDTSGACGKKGLVLFTKVFDMYGLLQKQGQPQRECWERLLIAHHRANGDLLYRGAAA